MSQPHNLPFIDQYEDLYGKELKLPGYEPVTLTPKTNSLNKVEHERMIEDLSGKPSKLIDYIDFCSTMSKDSKNPEEANLYKSMLAKLMKENEQIFEFTRKQNELFDKNLKDFNNDIGEAASYFVEFYNNFKDKVGGGFADKNKPLFQRLSKLSMQENVESGDLFSQVLTEFLNEAEYQGKKVTLNKPFRTPGGPKKFSVYTMGKKGRVIKVNFGDKKAKIKLNIPARKKSYCSRSAGIKGGGKDRTKANYWSRKQWKC